MLIAILYWWSFSALILTKIADVVSTLRSVPPDAESNPYARILFRRFGFKGGLAIVSLLFLAIVITQFFAVWSLQSPPLLIANTIRGFLISWIQWEVARFNTTQSPTRITSLILHAYSAWNRWSKK